MAKLKGVENWYGVIDGGGDRPDMDAKLTSLADLILLTFCDAHEDIRTVVQDLQRFPSAYALPSQWPTNPWKREAAARTLERMFASFRGRVLEPVHAQNATKILLEHALPPQLPAALNNSCRMLALQVMKLLGIPLLEDRWIPIAKQAA